MASFDHSITMIFQAEGGYVDHPTDKGGQTKFGITQGTLTAFNKFYTDDPATLHVRHLDQFRAREIYKGMYWDPLQLDDIEDQKLAHIIFDQAVNQGGQIAVKRMQRAYNVLTRGKGTLTQDGIVGPLTLIALNSCQISNRVALEFLFMSQDYYVNIVKVQPDQIAFLSGWINRTQKLIRFLLFSRL